MRAILLPPMSAENYQSTGAGQWAISASGVTIVMPCRVARKTNPLSKGSYSFPAGASHRLLASLESVEQHARERFEEAGRDDHPVVDPDRAKLRGQFEYRRWRTLRGSLCVNRLLAHLDLGRSRHGVPVDPELYPYHQRRTAASYRSSLQVLRACVVADAGMIRISAAVYARLPEVGITDTSRVHQPLHSKRRGQRAASTRE